MQLSFSTEPQGCDNVNNGVVTTLRRCASWVGFGVPIQHHDWLSFQSSLLERDDLQNEEIWKARYSSLTEYVLLTAKELDQSEEETEIVTNEDENRKITAAEALKKLDEVKNFIDVKRSDHLNMNFNESIENVEQIKL